MSMKSITINIKYFEGTEIKETTVKTKHPNTNWMFLKLQYFHH